MANKLNEKQKQFVRGVTGENQPGMDWENWLRQNVGIPIQNALQPEPVPVVNPQEEEERQRFLQLRQQLQNNPLNK